MVTLIGLDPVDLHRMKFTFYGNNLDLHRMKFIFYGNNSDIRAVGEYIRSSSDAVPLMCRTKYIFAPRSYLQGHPTVHFGEYLFGRPNIA